MTATAILTTEMAPEVQDSKSGRPPSPTWSVASIPSRGRGMVASRGLAAGEDVLVEEPFVVGPKQSSKRVCVECCRLIGDQQHPCPICQAPLCQSCQSASSSALSLHSAECAIFALAGKSFASADDRALHYIITPLRLLIKWQQIRRKGMQPPPLSDHCSERDGTLLYYFNDKHVVRPILALLAAAKSNSAGHEDDDGGVPEATAAEVHAACGALDTNTYEISWGDESVGVSARGLYSAISAINHECVPNCAKFFDADLRMHVVAAVDIAEGHEIALSYTPPIMATSVRQVILSRTKYFTCSCRRCCDPLEFGLKLSALRCSGQNCSGDVVADTDHSQTDELKCTECGSAMPAERANMMLDTAMRFAGQQSSSSSSSSCSKRSLASSTLATLRNLQRFLRPTHALIRELQRKFVAQVITALRNSDVQLEEAASAGSEQGNDLPNGHDGGQRKQLVAAGQSKQAGQSEKQQEDEGSAQDEPSDWAFLRATALDFCEELLRVAAVVAPGKSRLKATLSSQFHILLRLGRERSPDAFADRRPSGLVMPPSEIATIYSQDASMKTELH